MTKRRYYFKELTFDEKENELKENLQCYCFIIPKSFAITLRWLVCWGIVILSCIAWIVPFVIFRLDWILSLAAASALIGIVLGTLTADRVDKYCDEYTKFVRESLQNRIDFKNAIEEEKCKQWRKNHPLEEKCRLALTKNPNAMADLIRYIESFRQKY